MVSVPSLWQAGGLKLAQNRWSTSRGVLWSLTFLLNGLGVYSVTKCAETHRKQSQLKDGIKLQ